MIYMKKLCDIYHIRKRYISKMGCKAISEAGKWFVFTRT